MCGIAGEIRFKNDAKAQQVEDMLQALASRGPDGKGIYCSNNVTFGHRRLSVIDLSNRASQPMHDPKLGLTLVFNGCIYNYRKLREELQTLGYDFFSSSDSEVILKAFNEWGEGCLEKLSGMFVFAIFQRDTGEVFLARDRLGIKPLYFHHNEHGFWFASTLPALLQCDFIPVQINPAALHQYMSFRAIVSDHTLFQQMHKLKAGHWMKIQPDGSIETEPYWTLQTSISDAEVSEDEWKERLKTALYKSVEQRLEADVPVGVLLSGGLDSSLVVGMLSELGQKNIHTFSIGFENVGEDEGNEFKYSDIIARHYATDHHQINASDSTLLNHIKPCIAAMAEPMVSHDVIGFYLLSKEVSQHVKVVQSGQGADEVFGGYHWYPPMVEVDASQAAETYAQNYFSWTQAELNEVLAEEYRDATYAMDYIRGYFADCVAQLPINKALHLDTIAMATDDPIKRVDNMTMAFGLEARVPFLDHELVELAFQMPHELKLKEGGKYLLKQVARDIIPNEVIDRPKGYFPVPALRNMEGPYLELAREVFKTPQARQRGLFNMDYIDQMLAKPENFTGPFGSKLWQVTLLEMWLAEHNITAHQQG